MHWLFVLPGHQQPWYWICRVNHDDVIKWKHYPRYWPFVREIHRSVVNAPHKGQWRGAVMFSLICAWINRGVNNREAGDLRRYRTHYDVIVMWVLLFHEEGFQILASSQCWEMIDNGECFLYAIISRLQFQCTLNILIYMLLFGESIKIPYEIFLITMTIKFWPQYGLHYGNNCCQ